MEKNLENEILENLISKGLIYKGQRIYYSDVQRKNANDSKNDEPLFLELYEICRNKCTEGELARILKINTSTFSSNKKSTSKNRFYIKVFDKEELTEDEKEECRKYILEKYYIGKSETKRGRGIYYSHMQANNANDLDYKGAFFKEIYKTLPIKFKIKCLETELAHILGIENFAEFKTPNYKYKATLQLEISPSQSNNLHQEILEYIIEKYSLYKGQKIWRSLKDVREENYKGPFLQEMFESLPNNLKKQITIEDVMQMLGIVEFNSTRKMTIFLNQTLNEEEMQKCREYLINTYNLTNEYSKKGIFFSRKQKENSADTNYEGPYIEDMYNNLPSHFKTKCTIYEMIELIGTVNKNYREATYTNSKNKIVILKDQSLSEEEKQEIQKLVEELEFKTISYSEGENCFKDLLKKYKVKITEKEFARMLGITPYYLKIIKNNPKAKAHIRSIEKLQKTKQVLGCIKDTRFYTLKELECLCANFNIEVQDFLSYMKTGGKFNDSYTFKHLMKVGKIFIIKPRIENGSIKKRYDYPMEVETFEKLYDIFLKKVSKSANKLKILYDIKYEFDDLVQIGMSAIYFNCGDIERNFYNNQKFENEDDEDYFYLCIIGRAKRNMKNYIFRSMKWQKNIKNFTSKGYEEDDKVLISKKIKIIDDSYRGEDNEERKANRLKELIEYYIEMGITNPSEIFEDIEKKYGYSFEEMNSWLEILKKQMIENGFAKIGQSGSVMIGDEEK